jgi:ADP-ribose pyrophosphatase YjhB (NUDIX family)
MKQIVTPWSDAGVGEAMGWAYERRRGTAIIDTPNGIMVVKQGNAPFLLPGGGAKKYESRFNATVRELREEVGLTPYYIQFLFEFKKSKVFLVRAKGIPKPHHEISQIAYYTPQSNVRLSVDTRRIVDTFLDLKKKYQS